MRLNNIEHIYFDLDHTLWDFDKNSALAFKSMFETRRISIEVEDFLKVYIPVNFRFWELYRKNEVTKEALRYGRLKESFDLLKYTLPDEVIYELAEDYIRFLPFNNHLLQGCLELLNYLQPLYKLHIITNGFEEVQQKKMKNSGIFNFFQTVTTSEEVGVKKPDALIFKTALKKSEAFVENCVMIGDNYEADILGATNFGMKSIYFDYYKNSHPIGEIHIKTLNEIRSYL